MSLQDTLPGLGSKSDYHGFREQLEFANINTDLIQLKAFYKLAFPNVVVAIKITDIKRQRQGIDTMVVLKGGKKIYFDEKIRSKDYSDILLEEYSVWRGYPRLGGRDFGLHDSVPPELARLLKPGWISGKKQTDYITYVFKPSRRVYFLPFLLLQRTWRAKHLDWLAKYGRKAARNATYWTTNIPVPIDVLFKALYDTAEW